MFLSNPRKFFLLAGFCALIFQGCGSSPRVDNKEVSLTIGSKSKFPFSTKEPENYQGDIVMNNGKTEDHWFVARKGSKWRYDVFRGAERRMSQLRSDKLYFVDYQKQVYWETPEQRNPTGDTGYSSGPMRDFFRGVEHREFDEVGHDGNLIKYKVRETDQSTGEILIYIDTTTGMIVKQEFTSTKGQGDAATSFVYEIRNLKTDVDDSVFEIPPTFKKIAAEMPQQLTRN